MTPTEGLLSADDPSPVEWINRDSASPVAFVCEHAGRAVPARLDGLGIAGDELERHIGWDIGAARLARRLAARLDAPLVLQRYSRLVIDCNRPPDSPLAIPVTSDGTVVPANRDMSDAERERRVEEIFRPYDEAVTALLDRAPRRLAFSIHSFTPTLAGIVRPWDASFLFRRDRETSPALAEALLASAPELVIGMNEPYRIDDVSDWFIPRHAESRGLGHALVEIRNDGLLDDDAAERWAERLSDAMRDRLDAA